MMINPHQIRTLLAAIALCTAVGTVLFLSACGQKGPLYVPVEQADQEQEQPSQDN